MTPWSRTTCCASAPLRVRSSLWAGATRHPAKSARSPHTDARMRQGLDPAMYALCASRSSCRDQKLVTSPLARIGEETAACASETPALLVVGDVVGFWKGLHRKAAVGREP